ncbi:MAG: type II toxin-antitoxin system RelE/ParE family toxin [Novosphingobium sp.]|nr:type II toxin-antitoxin system RelE/ParE family toxin [Novosphingobium sp.]MBO9603489.1 type II toxin-antitoxin system RelE/ParE family toxin [Novosphingobium sp.]
MAEVFVSNAARSDLLSIDDYGVDRFGEEAADALSAGFERVFARLAGFPRSAPERPEYGKGIRCWMYLGYRVLHRIEGDTVVIVRVLHHSRDVGIALEE